MNIAIIRTGTANLASVKAAFARLSVPARVVTQPSELDHADAVVLPGVGAFAAGMQALAHVGWDRVIIERFSAEAPTLAICLGVQLLCRASAENPGVPGLGLLPADVRRLPDTVSVPHFGWNKLTSSADFFEDGYVYYANSYCVQEPDRLAEDGWEIAVTTHGLPFVGAVRRGPLMACQFHPELSGPLGSRLLSRWLAIAQQRLDQTVVGLPAEDSPC